MLPLLHIVYNIHNRHEAGLESTLHLLDNFSHKLQTYNSGKTKITPQIFAVRANIVARVTTARSVVCNMDYGIQDCDDATTADSISNRIYGGV